MPRKKITLKQVAATSQAIARAARQVVPPPPAPPLTEEQVQAGLLLTQADLDVLSAVARGQTFGQTRDMLAAIRTKLEFSTRKPEARGAHGSPVNVTIKVLKSTGEAIVSQPLNDEAADAAQYDENEDLQ